MRCSASPVSPNIRSNVTRGLMPTGSGLVSSRQDRVLKNVHGKPSQAPTAVPMSSVPTSIERSGVSPATCRRCTGRRSSSIESCRKRRRGLRARTTGPTPFRTRRWRRGGPRRPTAPHLADRHQLVAERLERLHDRLELEVRCRPAPGARYPATRRSGSRPRRSGTAWPPPSALRRQRRHHRVEQRQRHRGAEVPRRSAAGQVLLRDEHCYCSFARATVVARFGRLQLGPHLERRALDDARDDDATGNRSARGFLTMLRTTGISRLEAAAERVDHQLLGDGSTKRPAG